MQKLEYSEKVFNTMAADDLAPCVARSSAAMVLTKQDKQVLIYHKDTFQLPVPSQWWEIIENANVFYVSRNKLSTTRVNGEPVGIKVIFA